MAIRGVFKILLRKKPISLSKDPRTQLRRCLNTCQLIAIGLGSTLGATAYVLIGQVAMQTAGPSIVFSFLVAALGSFFAGLCYAELGSRMPRAGSVYDYTYTAVGEIYAFIVCWAGTFEYLCGSAYIARSLSGYFDLLADSAISEFYRQVAPLRVYFLAEYFDFTAFAIIILMGVLVGAGVKISTTVAAVLTKINFTVITFVIIAGAIKADPLNWYLEAADVPEGYGNGGFFPYGVRGMLDGAAICFYGYVGFESTTFATEEVVNAKRNLPVAIIVTLITICTLFCCVSVVQTMMLPYYLLDQKTALAQTFVAVGWGWARYVVLPGAACGMSASLFGTMMPLPRLWMAMARDGCFFKIFAKVHRRTRTPVVATVIFTAISAILTGSLEQHQLSKMLVVGTLTSYTAVAVCVIVMRYQYDQDINLEKVTMAKLFNAFSSRQPSIFTEVWANTSLVLYIMTVFISSWCFFHGGVSLIVPLILHVVLVLEIVIIAIQPQGHKSLDDHSFRTPLVPIIPCLGLYVNINLMVLIDSSTYVRVAIWFCVGIPIYIICLFIYKKYKINTENSNSFRSSINRPPLSFVIPQRKGMDDKNGDNNLSNNEKIKMKSNEDNISEEDRQANGMSNKAITIQQAIVESNEEKTAKIIDLLDQVLQAEEDSYEDVVSLQEQINVDVKPLNETHRESIGELSDAGSDASVNMQVLSNYNVVAQVHREDMPKVSEEDERNENGQEKIAENYIETNNEILTDDNVDSETNSHTDESGYSDTMKSTINESADFMSNENTPYIPTPPPLDETFFSKPLVQKSYSFTSRVPKIVPVEIEEETKPRASVLSNGSLDDGHIVFGSDKQMNFMTKLNTIFQSKIENGGEEEKKKRSHSTGNVIDNTALQNFERPAMFADLKEELLAKEASLNLRPVNTVNSKYEESSSNGDNEELVMSRDEMKSKLESIFASGGTQLVKPRLIKSKPETPESSQTISSSGENISKSQKIEKNDTLKRQKDKFSAVLNSFILNLNKDNEL